MTRLKNKEGLHNFPSRRAEWKHGPGGKPSILIKGANRQVVVVKSPDPQVFEEAIFVLREDWLKKRSAEQVVEEARRAASEYLVRNGGRRKRSGERVRALLYAAVGALAAGAAWITLHFAGV